MNTNSHLVSTTLQVASLILLSGLLGIAVAHFPITALFLFLLIGALIYTKTVLSDYHIILGAIILVIPFNFEGLIAAINIPYLNPFNLLWVSYVGVVLLRCAVYSERLLISTPLNLPIFLVIVSFSISFFHAFFVVNSEGIKHFIFPTYQQWLQWILFYFFCLKGIRSEKEAKQVILWVMIMLFFAGIQNIRDYAGMIALSKADTLERASGLFNNANYSASFFCYYLPIAVGLSFADIKNRWHHRFFILTAITSGIAIVVTYSRGGMASAAVACALIFVLSKVNPKMILWVLIVGAVILSSGNIKKRFSQTSESTVYGEKVDPSVRARLIAWSKAFYLIREAPLMGQGFFTFRYIKVEKFEEEASKAHGSGGMAVHNGFINILVNAGLSGLLAFIFVLGAILKIAFRTFRETKDPYWRGAAIGLMAAVLALVLVNLSGTRLYDRQMIAYFWILTAAIFRGNQFSISKKKV